METLAQDLRFGLRRLLRSPGFTAVALLTLGLGIGANTAIFSVVHGVLWRPLRFAEPDRVVVLFDTIRGRLGSMSPGDVLDLQARTRTLSSVGGFFTGGNGGTLTLTGQGDPLVVTASHVTASYFDVLGLPALHGRTFRAPDNQPGQHHVVIIGYALWRERFGGDPKVVGRSIVLNGEPYTLIGVLPEGTYRELGQIWLPFQYDQGFVTERGSQWVRGIGRLAPGQTIETATAEIATIGRQLAAEHPDEANGGLTARPLRAQMVGTVRPAMLLLLGAAGFVLLIACANVANLVLGRSVRREGEMALRAALGGSRPRLLRQLITESLVLSAGGGLLGLLIAVWGTDVLSRVRPERLLTFDAHFDAQVDPIVLLFTTAVTLATGLLVGCLPAWQATRLDLARALSRSGRGGAGAGVNRLRGLLVVSEMALAVLLLTGAGLLIRSFIHLQRVDPGFEATGALSFRFSLPDNVYGDGAKRTVFFDQLLPRLRALPGVMHAAASTNTPMAGRAFGTGLTVAGRPQPKPEDAPSIQVRLVTPDYFEAVGIPLRRGRLFTDADIAGARPVVVVSEGAVRKYFAGADPIGQHVTIGWRKIEGDVVGVVGDVKELGLRQPAEPQLYVVFAQAPLRNTLAVVVRTSVPPMSLANAVREAVRGVDPTIAVTDLQPLDEVLAASLAHSQFYMLLLGVFAGTALLLAAIGIFGVLSNAVAHRTREMGVRLALGAKASEVRRLVLREALSLAIIGIVAGLVASVPLTRLLATLLFELEPFDPLTVTSVVIVLLSVALLASYLPALRASRVDPVIALRAE